jgi:hypothetical protein
LPKVGNPSTAWDYFIQDVWLRKVEYPADTGLRLKGAIPNPESFLSRQVVPLGTSRSSRDRLQAKFNQGNAAGLPILPFHYRNGAAHFLLLPGYCIFPIFTAIFYFRIRCLLLKYC